MSDNIKDKLTSLMLQIQDLIMEDYEDYEDLQNAYNALANAIDYYVED